MQYTTADEVIHDIEIGIQETAEDMGPDFDADAGYADMVEAMCLSNDVSDELAYEVCRQTLGWVPAGLRQMRPGVAAIEDSKSRFI